MALAPRSAQRHIRIIDRSLKPLQARGVPATFGDSYAYGPILYPDRDRLAGSGVQILGQSIFTFTVNAPGLVLKEFGKGAAGNGVEGPRGKGDYAVVFTGALPVPAPILRGLARYGGCNVWCDDDVVISADERMVSLHATEKGPFLLHFPRTVKTVTDAITGQVVARNVAQLTVTLDPPENEGVFSRLIVVRARRGAWLRITTPGG